MRTHRRRSPIVCAPRGAGLLAGSASLLVEIQRSPVLPFGAVCFYDNLRSVTNQKAVQSRTYFVTSNQNHSDITIPVFQGHLIEPFFIGIAG